MATLFLGPVLDAVKMGINVVILQEITQKDFVKVVPVAGRYFRVTVKTAQHDRGKQSSKKMSALEWALLALSITLALAKSNTGVPNPITLLQLFPSIQGVDLDILIERIPAAAPAGVAVAA